MLTLKPILCVSSLIPWFNSLTKNLEKRGGLRRPMAVSWSFLYALFLPTILTKHQAFTPSSPISFRCKSRFFRVEFSLRPSAKAWQEKSGPWVQLLNWSNSESFLKIFNISHCDVNDSLATWEINKNSLCIFCIKFLWAHWLHFHLPVSYSFLYALFCVLS